VWLDVAAIRVILSQHDQMRNHAAGRLICSMGLATMMEEIIMDRAKLEQRNPDYRRRKQR